MKMIQVSEDALNSIKGMAEQDAKDAARYRWLKKHAGNAVDLSIYADWMETSESLDESIDAAMQTK